MSPHGHNTQPCAADDCDHLVGIWPPDREEHVKVCRAVEGDPGYRAAYYHIGCYPGEVPESHVVEASA